MMLHFDSVKIFLQMGGYAAYVWSAYSLVIAALCLNALLARRQFKRCLFLSSSRKRGSVESE